MLKSLHLIYSDFFEINEIKLILEQNILLSLLVRCEAFPVQNKP